VVLRAATLLISHAFVSQGPTTTQTYEAEQVVPRIGGVLPLVVAVEVFMVDEMGAIPVFSTPPGDAPDEGE